MPFSDPTLSTSSPKRKRNPPAPLGNPTPLSSSPSQPQPAMRLNTSIPGAHIITEEDGQTGSPRTKVAYHFQGLQLSDGTGASGGVSKLDLHSSSIFSNYGGSQDNDEEEEDEEETALRKRVKSLTSHTQTKPNTREIPETPDIRISKQQKLVLPLGATRKSPEPAFTISIPAYRNVDPLISSKAENVILHNDIDPVIFKSGSSASSTNTNTNTKSKPRTSTTSPRKRTGTPPLSSTPANSEATDFDPTSLTWHDSEITGHDPSDPDDDGEGINGIGFRPTAAEAYARMMKRRQQMVEYRNREAREARARRSERRRGGEGSVGSGRKAGFGGSAGDVEREKERETARRVRFLEGERGVGIV